MRFVLLFLAFVILTSPAGAQTTADEEEAIRAMFGQFEELFNKSDAEGAAGMYAPDATRTNLAGEVAQGRAEIQEMYAARMAERKA